MLARSMTTSMMRGTRKVWKLLICVLLVFLPIFRVAGAAHAVGKSNSFDVSTSAFVGKSAPELTMAKAQWILSDDADPTHFRAGTQVSPNPGGTKEVLSYIVVDSAAAKNTQTVETDIHLDGRIPTVSKHVKAKRLRPEQQWSKIEKAIKGGIDAGLITLAQGYELLNRIYEQRDMLYVSTIPMHHDDPAGRYKVLLFIHGKRIPSRENREAEFEWVPTGVLEMDFQDMDFGIIKPNVITNLNGDTSMKTTKAPSLQNQGNAPLFVKVDVEPLAGSSTGARISEFAVRFGSERVSINAPQIIEFQKPLEINETQGISFSVTPPLNAKPDKYAGSISISALVRNTATALDNTTPVIPRPHLRKVAEPLGIGENIGNNGYAIGAPQLQDNVRTGKDNAGSKATITLPDAPEAGKKGNSLNDFAKLASSMQEVDATPDTNAPQVGFKLKPPADIEENYLVTVFASDNESVKTVKLVFDNQAIGDLRFDSQNSCYIYDLDTKQFSDGEHALVAKAYDAAGNEGVSETLKVKINNTAPSAPNGLQATSRADAQKAAIELKWNANQESDLAGYNIYRKISPDGEYEKANLKPIETIKYINENVVYGNTYGYVVKAIDASGKESGPSNEVMVTTTMIPSQTAASTSNNEALNSDSFEDNNSTENSGLGTPYQAVNN